MKIKILVAAHKNYKMPNDKELYLPIFVGKALHPDVNESFQGDNTGNNISEKNPNYNELTAIYWAWKNLDADAVGLVHYRRYLSLNKKKDLGSVLTKSDVEELFQNADVILPQKRRYYVETNYSHYVHAHYSEPLQVTRDVISTKFALYLDEYDRVMKRRSAHMFNMFIMKRPQFNQYCEWLFDILGEVEKRVDISSYSDYEKRVFGFISELLLDVWLNVNQVRTTEVKYVFMERQNWFVKGGKFLQRKLTGFKG